jgi:hypothetical protein
LHLPRLPGQVVDDVLRAPGPVEAQIAVVRACVEALYRAHQSGDAAFSHGDATVRNFLWDPVMHTARLFDFETEHDPDRSPSWRRADDLRALTGSAAARLPPERYPELVCMLAEAYPDPAVGAACLALWRDLRRRPDPFHLAQTRLPAAGHTALIEAWERAQV